MGSCDPNDMSLNDKTVLPYCKNKWEDTRGVRRLLDSIPSYRHIVVYVNILALLILFILKIMHDC